MTRIRISLTTKKEIPQLWIHKEDKDTDIFGEGYEVRSCANGGCPAVFVLNEPKEKVKLTKDWQYYTIGMNYRMTRENIFLILDNHLAFANQTGFVSLSNPGKKDFFFGRTEYDEYPRFDKDRTCSRNLLSGQVVGDKLKLVTFDGNSPPPMKPGKSLPQTLSQINIDDYLYNPREHPWMFVVANRVTVKPGNQTSVAPFPRGAQYPWTGDDKIYTFLPLISREEIYYPLKYLTRLDMTKPLPSPYRIVTT